MRRRTVLLVVLLAVIALGAAFGVYAASRDDQPRCVETTFTVPDTERPNMMTYHKTVCGDETAP